MPFVAEPEISERQKPHGYSPDPELENTTADTGCAGGGTMTVLLSGGNKLLIKVPQAM